MRLARLHEAEARVLDFFLGIILCFLQVLVSGLELFDTLLEIGLGLFNLCLALRNDLFEVGWGHCEELFNIRLLVVFAKINVLGRAQGLEAFFGKLFEGIVVAATLVVLKITRIPPLDGWLHLKYEIYYSTEQMDEHEGFNK